MPNNGRVYAGGTRDFDERTGTYRNQTPGAKQKRDATIMPVPAKKPAKRPMTKPSAKPQSPVKPRPVGSAPKKNGMMQQSTKAQQMAMRQKAMRGR